MIRLGLRLAFLGGRWSVVPTALTAVAVAFGTAILLFALSFEPASTSATTAARGATRRAAWRCRGAGGTTLISLTNDYVEGRPLAGIDVAGLGGGARSRPA